MGLAAVKPTKGLSLKDKLREAKATTPKAKKESMPTLTGPENIQDATDAYAEAKRIFKMAEAKMQEAGDALIDFVRQVQDQQAYNGNFNNSWAVQGKEHLVKVVFSNRYSINPEDGDELHVILGDAFDQLISEKYQVKVKDEVLQDELLGNELMELLGDKFDDFFTMTKTLAVCDNFSQILYQFVGQERLPALRTYAKQFKPSLR